MTTTHRTTSRGRAKQRGPKAVSPRAYRPPAPRLRLLSTGECEALLARNAVGRIAVAHRGHVNITPINYVYAAGWLFARADGAMRTAIGRNRWVAVEVAEVNGVSDWKSVVVRGACYVASSRGSAAADAAASRGVARLRREIPEMTSPGAAAGVQPVVFRVHAAELSGCAAALEVPLPASAMPRSGRAGGRRVPPRSTIA